MLTSQKKATLTKWPFLIFCFIRYTFSMKEELLTINGETFVFVKERNQMPVSIYKGQGCYIRIGPTEYIEQEIAYHKNLERFGFPIPTIVSEGQHEDLQYFIETSLGEEHLGQIFTQNAGHNAEVTKNDFEMALPVFLKFTKAQLKTITITPFDSVAFREFIKLENIIEELPQLANLTEKAITKAESRISQLPTVLTHGDFNPYNIFETGVIDWEQGANAPLGYDLVTNVIQSMFFPITGDYEFKAGYRLTKEQITQYWQELNALCADTVKNHISSYTNDFIFCREVWSVVRMERWPKIQSWRYTLYNALLTAYLADEDLTDFLLNYDT